MSERGPAGRDREPEAGPSSLILIVHRILIGTAVAFGLFYTTWEVRAFLRTGEARHLVAAIVAAVITLAMAYYLKNLRRFVGRR